MAVKKSRSEEEIERVGFHKGSLATLSKEREELSRMVQIVEQLMQMHIKGLKELGVDLEAAAKEAQKTGKKEKKPAKPIEDMLR